MPENQKKVNTQDEDVEVQDPGFTEFVNVSANLQAMSESLRKMKELNPQTLRMHLLNDLYPLLIDFANTSHWYVGDLHGRVSEVEEEVGGDTGEGLDPEFAAQLIEFIGISLQLFGVLVNVCKGDPEVIGKVQLLIAQAPGLIAKINDLTLEEEDDDDEDEDDEDEEEDEDIEVLEPTKAKPSTPAPEAAPEAAPVGAVDAASADAPVVPATNTPSPDAAPVTTSGGPESTNG